MSKKNKITKVVKPVKTFKLLEEETIMSDDAIAGGMYVYIADGVFRRCWHVGLTIGEWKNVEGIKEVRRCNLFGHEGACLGDKVA